MGIISEINGDVDAALAWAQKAYEDQRELENAAEKPFNDGHVLPPSPSKQTGPLSYLSSCYGYMNCDCKAYQRYRL